MKNLFLKELRDVMRWSPLGIVLLFVLGYLILPKYVNGSPGIEATLTSQFGLGASIIAIGYGLLQSIFDTRNDSRGFLLHRPISTAKIYWIKILAGLVAYYATLLLPTLWFASYLQIQGIEKLPTNGWQVTPFLICSLFFFCFHPAAIWVVNRDAKWVGTKLLPALGVGASILGVTIIFQQSADVPWFVWSVWFLSAVCLVAVTLMGGYQAFVNESFLLPESSPRRRSLWSNFALLVSVFTCVGTTLAFLFTFVDPPRPIYEYYSIEMDREGNWQEVKKTLPDGSWETATNAIRPAGSTDAFQEIDTKSLQVATCKLDAINFEGNSKSVSRSHPFIQFLILTSSSSTKVQGGSVLLYLHRGRILVYRQIQGLVAVITPDGTFSTWSEATGRFRNVQVISNDYGVHINFHAGSGVFISDANRLYQFDGDTLTLNKLIDSKVDAVGLMLPSKENPASLWTLQDQEFVGYQLESLDPDQSFPLFNDPVVTQTHRLKIPLVRLGTSVRYPTGDLDFFDGHDSVRLFQDAAGKIGFAQSIPGNPYRTNQVSVRKIEESKSDIIALSTSPRNHLMEGLQMLVVPPSIVVSGFAIARVLQFRGEMPSTTTSMLACLLIHVILGAGLSYFAARWRTLAPNKQAIWGLMGALIGISTPLAILAIYKRRLSVTCSECHKPRFVEETHCATCQAAWPRPSREGIEIFAS